MPRFELAPVSSSMVAVRHEPQRGDGGLLGGTPLFTVHILIFPSDLLWAILTLVLLVMAWFVLRPKAPKFTQPAVAVQPVHAVPAEVAPPPPDESPAASEDSDSCDEFPRLVVKMVHRNGTELSSSSNRAAHGYRSGPRVVFFPCSGNGKYHFTKHCKKGLHRVPNESLAKLTIGEQIPGCKHCTY